MGKLLKALKARSRLVGVIGLVVIIAGAATGGYFIYKSRVSADTPFDKPIKVAVNNFVDDQTTINKYYGLRIGNFKREPVDVTIKNIPDTTANHQLDGNGLLNQFRTQIGSAVAAGNSAKVKPISKADFIAKVGACFSSPTDSCKGEIQKYFIVESLKQPACEGSTPAPPPPPPA
jgi:hypothetical protein